MTERDQGIYKCVAINSVGMQDEDEVDVRIGCFGPSAIHINGSRDNGLYELDSMLLLKCNATANPAPSYVWTKDGRIFERDSTIRYV